MKVQKHQLNLFADYFQFYVCDGGFQTDTSTIWNDDATELMLAIGSDLIAVGTARNMDVPVTLEISNGEPDNDLEQWDQVIECSLNLNSGTLIAFGCTEDPKLAAHYPIEIGYYVVRISYGNLTDISIDGLDGNDKYRVQLWPGSIEKVVIIKQRTK